MNQMKSAIRNMKDRFNSPNLPDNDTISGMKAAMVTYQDTTRAITLHEMEKDQIKPNQGNPIVTGEELRAYFDRNARTTQDEKWKANSNIPITDTKDKNAKVQEDRELGE